MTNYTATIYAHDTSFDEVTHEIKTLFPEAVWEYDRQNEMTIASIKLKTGFLKNKKRLTLTYRERDVFDVQLDDCKCAVCRNLRGMSQLISTIPSKNKAVQELLIKKIGTINCEITISNHSGAEKEFKKVVQSLSTETDGFIVAQPRTGLMNSLQQAWLDSELALIVDMEGNSNVNTLNVQVSPRFLLEENSSPSESSPSENFSTTGNALPNSNSLNVASSDYAEVNSRSAEEVSERLVALALTNLVAFDNLSGPSALQFANKKELISLLTPKEIEFLKNPDPLEKKRETWRCESIWVLSWALGIVDQIGTIQELVDLSTIPGDAYPIGSEIEPHDFLKKFAKTPLRSKDKIIEQLDYYEHIYSQIRSGEFVDEGVSTATSALVLERLLALSWLVNEKKQSWDNPSLSEPTFEITNLS